MLASESFADAVDDVSLADSPPAVLASPPLVPPPQAASTAADRKAKVIERGREEF